MARIKEIFNWIDQKAPFSSQLDFDNAGFLVGKWEGEVTRVLVALDITKPVIEEAAQKGAQLIGHLAAAPAAFLLVHQYQIDGGGLRLGDVVDRLQLWDVLLGNFHHPIGNGGGILEL